LSLRTAIIFGSSGEQGARRTSHTLNTAIKYFCGVWYNIFRFVLSFNPGDNDRVGSGQGKFTLKLIVEKGSQAGTAFRLYDGINTLGREKTNRIRVMDLRVSRHHCEIRKVAQSLFVTDLGTRNGTSVNGNTARKAELKIGDRIQIGNTVLRVAEEEAGVAEAIQPPVSTSFLQHVSAAFWGNRRNQKPASSNDELGQLIQKSRRSIWKPPAQADVPEGRRTTLD